MSQLGFLEAEFAAVFEAGEKAERYALSDPGTSAIHARRALESGVKWVFTNDRELPQPYENQLNAYLNEPAFKAIKGGKVFTVAKKIQRAGNKAVHEAQPLTKYDAVGVISALFQFCHWLAFTYGRIDKPDPALKFDPHKLMTVDVTEKASLAERQELEERLNREVEEAESARQQLLEANHTIAELEAQRAELMTAVFAAKKVAEETPDEIHDWSEAETRVFKIDLLLAEAGWLLTDDRDREYPVEGMPNNSGEGFVDYVLWGDDGLPLALIEAKRATVSPESGQQQAKLYADCLEKMHGQRPVIFYSNGFEHWLWDDTQYPPRSVQGFFTKDELALLIQRRTSKVSLNSIKVNKQIVERFYQHRAIAAISEHFEINKQRKSLLVMATGAGKTRTVIALTDLLMRANWAKRILFLCDRTALVNQAINAFKTHLPDSSPINLVTEGNQDGRVYVSTYQTMVRKIDEYRPDGTRRFGAGHFDLIVIDEAHRSVYRKYRGIFEYFDSLLVGLTATPKDEVDKNTYDLFELETGVPTDAYSLDEAIKDGYLLPPRGVSVPVKFVREGIKYDELSEAEKGNWDLLDWGEDEDGGRNNPPDRVEAAEINKWLFNEDTVDKALKHLMTEGIKVAGGDRLGKTIIFAKSQDHARYIYERFIANYPHLDNGNFARIITYETKYAQSLIDDFYIKDKSPHIAISVDMLDTGIDVPECVNLVFFKLVRSKTKFWQMIGRGTRLCPDLFGPDDHKAAFNVFDFCQNLEYFNQPLIPADMPGMPPLSEQIFKTRLELIEQCDTLGILSEERDMVAATLREMIASMNEHNFLVRPHLQLVEKFREQDAWKNVSIEDFANLASSVAALPDQLNSEHEESKRFDLLVLKAQLNLLQNEPLGRKQQRIIQIASLLEAHQVIPVVAEQLEIILELKSEEWWTDINYSMLEEVRKKLRLLVPLIEKEQKKQIFTDFEDLIGESSIVEITGADGTQASTEFAQFRKKAEHFLKENLAEPAIDKVRSGQLLLPEDIEDLQRILVAAGIGDAESFEVASHRAGSFGLFIRSLIGLEKAAAKEVFNDFLDDKNYSRNQIEFINLIINYLTEHGTLEPGRIYESPFSDVAPEGPESLFVSEELENIFESIENITASASGSI